MRSPVRIILDANLRIPFDAKVIQTATKISTWIISNATIAEKRKKIKNEL